MKTTNIEQTKLTIAPFRDAAAQASPPAVIKPEWIRLPKPGTLDPYFGLSRTVLYQLCKQSKVKSIVLRQRGAARGIRMICFDSVSEFCRSLDAEQNENAKQHPRKQCTRPETHRDAAKEGTE